MIYRLGSYSLGRAFGDNRDHYGKKRSDISGVSGIFRQLFRKLTKKLESNIREHIKTTQYNLKSAFDKNIITN